MKNYIIFIYRPNQYFITLQIQNKETLKELKQLVRKNYLEGIVRTENKFINEYLKSYIRSFKNNFNAITHIELKRCKIR